MARATTTTTTTTKSTPKSHTSTVAKKKKASTKNRETRREARTEGGEREPRTRDEPNSNVGPGSVLAGDNDASLHAVTPAPRTGTEPRTEAYFEPSLVGAQPEWNLPESPMSPSMMADSQEYGRTKKKQSFEKKCMEWCDNIITRIGKKMFAGMQFVRSKDEEYGSDYQKIVCKHAEVDPDLAEEFWNRRQHGGRMTARTVLNRRRMNITNAMKKKFMGKFFQMGWEPGCCFTQLLSISFIRVRIDINEETPSPA